MDILVTVVVVGPLGVGVIDGVGPLGVGVPDGVGPLGVGVPDGVGPLGVGVTDGVGPLGVGPPGVVTLGVDPLVVTDGVVPNEGVVIISDGVPN